MYKTFDQNVLNPKHKKLNWFNRNYFYATTALIVALLCLSYFLFQHILQHLVSNVSVYYNVVFMALCHTSLQQLVFNIVSFGVISFFLERHFGSLKYLGIIVLAAPITALATFACSFSWDWMGFSGINYFLYTFFYITLILRFKEYFCGKARWIFPLAVLGINLLITCWVGNTANPTEFLKFGVFSNFHIVSNWASCIAGSVVGAFACLIRFDLPKKKTKTEKVLKKKKTISNVKSNNIVMLGKRQDFGTENKKQNIIINLNVKKNKK